MEASHFNLLPRFLIAPMSNAPTTGVGWEPLPSVKAQEERIEQAGMEVPRDPYERTLLASRFFRLSGRFLFHPKDHLHPALINRFVDEVREAYPWISHYAVKGSESAQYEMSDSIDNWTQSAVLHPGVFDALEKLVSLGMKTFDRDENIGRSIMTTIANRAKRVNSYAQRFLITLVHRGHRRAADEYAFHVHAHRYGVDKAIFGWRAVLDLRVVVAHMWEEPLVKPRSSGDDPMMSMESTPVSFIQALENTASDMLDRGAHHLNYMLRDDIPDEEAERYEDILVRLAYGQRNEPLSVQDTEYLFDRFSVFNTDVVYALGYNAVVDPKWSVPLISLADKGLEDAKIIGRVLPCEGYEEAAREYPSLGIYLSLIGLSVHGNVVADHVLHQLGFFQIDKADGLAGMFSFVYDRIVEAGNLEQLAVLRRALQRRSSDRRYQSLIDSINVTLDRAGLRTSDDHEVAREADRLGQLIPFRTESTTPSK